MMSTAPAPAAEEEPDDGEWDDDSEEEGGWDEGSDEEEDPRSTPSMSSGGGGAGAVTGGSANEAAAGGDGGIKRRGAKTQTMKRSGVGIRSSAYTKAGTEECKCPVALSRSSWWCVHPVSLVVCTSCVNCLEAILKHTRSYQHTAID